ncbi:hypothetical protein [Microbacterium sp.]|uniref:hypothetical protein n=1 Tax=Microbacterium sp. TaxID=51671 RepID=UPI0025F21621|nr:hypothetical protein [Microbacterium sp.]
MTEILHAWALAPAAIGTCCLAADRRRVRAPELAASLLMLLAMLDSALGRMVAPVLWAALLLLGAMGLAAAGRRRGRASGVGNAMTLHSAIGMIAMAGLLLPMAHQAGGTTASTAHAHGMSSATLIVALLAGSAVYAAGSVAAALRAHSWLDRAQYMAMGTSTLVMGVALLG